ncbi:hypothetical protein [Cerasicoccus maritimus]|uniref:hypothetical protein n=1 Tax=Cerasicoccus maritimus TaxID=490089 RepID=UPI0028528D39|nr:hypothetical protein [Cerasicoccus maritimus]
MADVRKRDYEDNPPTTMPPFETLPHFNRSWAGGAVVPGVLQLHALQRGSRDEHE